MQDALTLSAPPNSLLSTGQKGGNVLVPLAAHVTAQRPPPTGARLPVCGAVLPQHVCWSPGQTLWPGASRAEWGAGGILGPTRDCLEGLVQVPMTQWVPDQLGPLSVPNEGF